MGCEDMELNVNRPENVSIHTPAWGVKFYHFGWVKIGFVSIHTPAWGVKRQSSPDSQSPSFNPHTRMGCELSF